MNEEIFRNIIFLYSQSMEELKKSDPDFDFDSIMKVSDYKYLFGEIIKDSGFFLRQIVQNFSLFRYLEPIQQIEIVNLFIRGIVVGYLMRLQEEKSEIELGIR